MENGKEIVKSLDSINQKVNFILSEVSGVKENLTKEDLEEIEYNNTLLSEQVENEEELLSFSTDSMEDESEDVLTECLALKLVNMVFANLGEYDNANDSDFEDIVENAVLDEEDISLLLKKKDTVINYINENYGADDNKEAILKAIEELTNEQ